MKKGKAKTNHGLLPNSLRIISSCLKTVSTNSTSVASTVRSAGASVASTVSSPTQDRKDQVTWAGFDKLELGPSASKHVLLLGYQNGFQVLDVEDASNFNELVSKRDGPVTFLQMQPIPEKSDDTEGFRRSHPLLLVVAGDDTNSYGPAQNRTHLGGFTDGNIESQAGNCVNSPTTVRFYSLRSHSYVHVLRFRSAVFMIRCSPRIVAVGLSAQIYCFDALTLENKFSVLTYPIPQVGGHGAVGVNIGYGPMAVGPRWLAYASNSPLLSNMGRLSPQNLSPSPGVSPSTSPNSGNLVARYALESSKQLTAGIINLGDMGYRTLSRYCQELLPDGSSSPVSPSSGWKVRLATEAENAGMVVVKDFVSRSVISQFKAHTSPISALCFDPSGTLLVTASIHGNNINIFRIMPYRTSNRSSTQSYDWNSSHVLLYKLYRGITTAIIQDICFSHYSQWIAIVSSKGTCHVFVISPFGGDTGFQTPNFQGEGSHLCPVLSTPWWSTSSCIINQQPCPPPQPITLSVVSRIKNSNSGWLSTVSNAASGKVSIPSGAVAAIFHNSISQNLHHVHASADSSQHVLVYTPSGHVIQYELLPTLMIEPSDSGSVAQIQDEELRMKVRPVQWWDVCRRSDLPERVACISGITFDKLEAVESLQKNSSGEENDKMYLLKINDSVREKNLPRNDMVNLHERSHWYLSNAEVQISCGNIPIWQRSNIFFHMVVLSRAQNYARGEFEIEKYPTQEVDIKQKDLLPFFDHIHCIKSGWTDRYLSTGRHANASSSAPYQAKDKINEETVICHSNPASFSSTESSEGGSSRRYENLLDLDQIVIEKSYMPSSQTPNEFYEERRGIKKTSPSLPKNAKSHILDNGDANQLSSAARDSSSAGITIVDGHLSSNTDCFQSNADTITEGPAKDALDIGPFFQEGYCKVMEFHGLTEAVNDSGSLCKMEQPPDDEVENDEMLGGIFAFSEEG